MAIKVRIPRRKSASGAPARKPGQRRTWRDWMADPRVKAGVAGFLVFCTVALGVFAYYYRKYEKIIDRRMSGQVFNNVSQIYARAKTLRPGESVTRDEILAYLRRAGYTDEKAIAESRLGTFRVVTNGIEIKPGAQSFHGTDPVLVKFEGGNISKIAGLGKRSGDSINSYRLEPQLVTALFEGEQRAKRRLITYNEIPKVMVDSVLSIEDRRFFQHSGVNVFRLMSAVWTDIREGRREQGGSTITMQISRGFFLTPEKTYKRKAIEMLIAFELEQRFSKEQIFEFYANQVYMGQRGSFTINGFAEAARAYFDKDIKSLTLPEAATLAGIIQRPNYFNPYKHPQRVMERRNIVLEAMVDNGLLAREEADKAKAMPLNMAPPSVEASDAPYFVDLVKEQLLTKYSEQDLNENAYRIYTTIDPELQQAAADAVDIGLKEADKQIEKLRTKTVKVGTGKDAKTQTIVRPGPQAQVALIAMNPKTGEVLALVGGRNYAWSQLNHATARRPTGSVFKPFVYAAAMATALDQTEPRFTPVSMIDDSPTTFAYEDKVYEPRNYKAEYHGPVTARYALALSLNNATVRLAELVGYEKVAALAKQAGISSVQPTPAMALGAYDATPLEVAQAYTMFANGGTRVTPRFVNSIRNGEGEIVQDFDSETKPILDPRVAYVVTNMMEGVINFGTAYPVRARGFNAPAAGKTGSSHDAWFAGFTSNLLCIVWVGYDDYSDIKLSGAYAAAPIWAEFMKRAVKLDQYKDTRPFQQPPGVIDVTLDKATNALANEHCATQTYTAAFIEGTEPTDSCDHAGGSNRGFFSKLFGIGGSTPAPQPVPVVDANTPRVLSPGSQPQAAPPQQQAQQQPPDDKKKKKGFWGRIFGADDEEKKKEEERKRQQQQQQQPQGRPAPAPPVPRTGTN